MRTFNLILPRLTLVNFIIILSSSIGMNCQENKLIKNDIQLLEEFEKNILTKDSLDLIRLGKYVDLHRSLRTNSSFIKKLEYVIWNSKEGRTHEPEKHINHSFIHYSELATKHPELTNMKFYKSLDYKKKKNVYYGLNENKTIITGLFILEKGKVISFFPYLSIGGDIVKPFLLNKRADKNYIKNFNKYTASDKLG